MKFVSFDTETTGFSAETCRTIELAAETFDENFRVTDRMDMLIRLPEGEKIPKEIVKLTNITDEMLLEEGYSEKAAASRFSGMIFGEDTVLVAHNANFDINFVTALLKRAGNEEGLKSLKKAKYLDTLTIARDRKVYPHRLEAMIEHYKLQAENSHRAIDDAHGVTELLKAFIRERNDVFEYLNIFGYNPKYGVPETRHDLQITYVPQPYRYDKDLIEQEAILPRRKK